MDKEEAVKQLRKRLLMLFGALVVSYACSFGVAIFLFADSGVLETAWGWPVIGGFAVLAFIHLRSQFRRYDYLVRMAESSEDE